jgi:hypothetical protein
MQGRKDGRMKGRGGIADAVLSLWRRRGNIIVINAAFRPAEKYGERKKSRSKHLSSFC